MLCLISVPLCLHNVEFGEQTSAWLSVGRTEWILLNFGEVIAVGIFIHHLKTSLYIYIYIYLLIFRVSLIAFNDQLAFMVFIPESLTMVLLFPLPTLPRYCFVGKPSFHPSYKEHAEFMVRFWISFNLVPNQKCISKNGGWLQQCVSHPCYFLWAQNWGWINEMLDSLREYQLKAAWCRDCFSSSWVWQSPNKLISWGTHLTHVLLFPRQKAG